MAHSKIALYALIVKQFRVYHYILDEDKQDDPDVRGNKGENKKLFESMLYYFSIDRTDSE